MFYCHIPTSGIMDAMLLANFIFSIDFREVRNEKNLTKMQLSNATSYAKE
jgi:hypothetical protein